MAEAIRTGRSQRNLELLIKQPNGRRIWALLNVDQLKNEADEITGAINCFRDNHRTQEIRGRGSEPSWCEGCSIARHAGAKAARQ